MNEYLMLIPIFLPILAGITLILSKPKTKKARNIFTFIAVLINSLVVLLLVLSKPSSALTILSVTDNIKLVLQLDGLGTVFAALLAFLWPLATLYAFEYMEHYSSLDMFFAFYTMTYGITIGLAFSGNALTMYLFYEFLTLVTTPLVLHTQKREAVVAARKYLYYSITGAAIGFISIVFVLIYGENASFAFGGIIDPNSGFDEEVIRFIFVLSFMGFGVKSAVFPLHGWLPSASVAPTPVTALLHAVAVVKAGVFVIMRMTYYIFGTALIEGSWAQAVVLSFAAFTVVYGAFMAVKEQHFKRRLAYSTISNLSYILLGVCLMTPYGLYAALVHMIFHAVMKISSFFCAGAVMEQADAHYVKDLEGLGKKMPFTFTCFTIAALSLMGMPPLIGFMSKFNLMSAAIQRGDVIGNVAIVALFISAVLVAVYLIFISIRAFFPRSTVSIRDAKDPGIRMKIPIAVFTVFIVIVGMFSSYITDYLEKISLGFI